MAKNKGGRPKIIPSDFPKGWEDYCITLYQQGSSDVEIKSFLNIANDTFDRLIREEQLFMETIKRGRAYSRTWWEKNARENLKDKDFNATLWYMNMKNRFGWADKSEIKQDNTNTNIEINTKDLKGSEAQDILKQIINNK